MNLVRFIVSIVSALTIALFASSYAFAQSETLTNIVRKSSALLQAQQAEQAYRLLYANEAQFAGDTEFDFQLGLAAIESGRPAIAIFALERVVTAQPDNLRAKTELARAYAANKETAAAKEQLNELLNNPNPDAIPQPVRRNLERFLSAIVQQEHLSQEGNRHPNRWGLTAEFGLGWDSNATLGSSKSEWIGAGGLTLYPSRSLLGQNSSVVSSSLSSSHWRPISDRLRWANSASIGQVWNLSRARTNMNANLGTVDLRTGLLNRVESSELSMTMLAQHQRLNNDASRNSLGLNAQWQRPVASSRVAIYAQGFHFSHPGNELRNTRRHSLGASLVGSCCSEKAENGTGYVLSAAITRESPSALGELGFHLQSLRASVEQPLSNRVKIAGSVGFERRQYDEVPVLFSGQERRDRELDIRLNMDYAVNSELSLVPSVSYTRNLSTVAANDYRRTQYFLFARYRF